MRSTREACTQHLKAALGCLRRVPSTALIHDSDQCHQRTSQLRTFRPITPAPVTHAVTLEAKNGHARKVLLLDWKLHKRENLKKTIRNENFRNDTVATSLMPRET